MAKNKDAVQEGLSGSVMKKELGDARHGSGKGDEGQ